MDHYRKLNSIEQIYTQYHAENSMYINGFHKLYLRFKSLKNSGVDILNASNSSSDIYVKNRLMNFDEIYIHECISRLKFTLAVIENRIYATVCFLTVMNLTIAFSASVYGNDLLRIDIIKHVFTAFGAILNLFLVFICINAADTKYVIVKLLVLLESVLWYRKNIDVDIIKREMDCELNQNES